jgi:hypothetical protein
MIRKKHVFLLLFAHLFVSLASPKILSFGKAQINLAFRSFIRIFATVIYGERKQNDR